MSAYNPDDTARLLSIATAVPVELLPQDVILAESRNLLESRFPQFDRLVPAFLNAGC